MSDRMIENFTEIEIEVLEEALKESRAMNRNLIKSCGKKIKKETSDYALKKEEILTKLIDEVVEEL